MSARTGDGVKTLLITVLGSGFSPFASGTVGSAVAVLLFLPLWWAVAALDGSRMWLEGLIALGVVTSSFLSVRWGPWAIDRFGHLDPKQFTLDEFAGQWVALLAMPIATDATLWPLACVVGGQFFLFRAFDVLKPPPARQAERLPAGWGVLCDDLIAGAFALLVGQLLWRLTPLATWLGLSGVFTIDGGA